MENRFALSSEDCEILLAFEMNTSLKALSEKLGKDMSVVSRNLKSISERAPVLEKRGGRWELTSQGENLNKWTREAIYSQKLAINRQKSLRIATTREFSGRVLLPKIGNLIGTDDIAVSIVSSDKGIEHLLLSGEADFGFDCGRPVEPLISFKQVINEPFAVVAAPKFIKKNNVKKFDDLQTKHHLKFTRTDNVILDLEVEAACYYGTFTDIAALRQACVLGYGWTILPLYTVKQEIKDGKLKKVPGLKVKDERYGVWWLRERTSVLPWISKATDWLKEQRLD